MLSSLWHDFLYQPLFNGLIWIYNNWTDQNMGWAIIYLTLILRVLLLPFTLVTERDNVRNRELIADVKRLDKEYGNDEILKKEEIRRILKKRKISPWAKIVSLGFQALVLVLLYQVFVRGITGDKILKILYPFIEFPGMINTMFYGFDLTERHDIILPGIVALWLAVEIYVDYRQEKLTLQKSDLAYFIFFPIGVFFALWWLPDVKALFVLTSMAFSAIIGQFSKVMFRSPKPKASH